MNDDFLHKIRVDPPARFLAELKAKLDRQGIAPPIIRRVSLRKVAILMFLGGTGAAMALIVGGVGGGLLPWSHQLRAAASAASSQPESPAVAPTAVQSPPPESTTNSSMSTIDEGELRSGIQKSAIATPAAQPLDSWDRATQLLGAAKAGDRDAQYHLFAVIDWCNAIMESYFIKDGIPLTLEEGLEHAPNASQKRQAQEEFPHCHRFREHNVALELGSADYWLEKATESGQPLAQAVTARRRLDQDAQNSAVPLVSSRSGGMLISIPSGAPPDRRAVDLLRAAVKSLDPQVLEIIGNEQTELHGSRMGEIVDRFAWIYVACQRGLNCSATSHLATDCPENCDVSTPEGIIMAWSRDEWPAVQQRAREISAKLDAGQWDELGLGP